MIDENAISYNGANYQLDFIDKLLYNEYLKLIYKNYLDESELKIKYIKNAIILPAKKSLISGRLLGGAVNELNEYIDFSANIAGGGLTNRMEGKYKYHSTVIVDKRVVYFGYLGKHWGHFLIDCILRCWYMLKTEYLANPIPIVYFGDVIRGAYKQFIDLLGLSDYMYHIDQPTQFAEIVFPEQCCLPGEKYHKEYKMMFDYVVCSAEMNTYKKYQEYDKIYFSRKNIKKSRISEIGERDIELFYKKNGYYIIFPEELDLVEQIHYIRNAKEIVCIEGTLPHNMMFAMDGSRITIIKKSCTINVHQFIINQIRQLNVTYVDAFISYFDVDAKGPYYLSIGKCFKRYAEYFDLSLNKDTEEKRKNKWMLLFFMYLKFLPAHRRELFRPILNILLFQKDTLDYKIFNRYFIERKH